MGLFYHRADDLDAQARVSATVTHAPLVGVDGAAVARTDIIRGRMVLVRELITAIAALAVLAARARQSSF